MISILLSFIIYVKFVFHQPFKLADKINIYIPNLNSLLLPCEAIIQCTKFKSLLQEIWNNSAYSPAYALACRNGMRASKIIQNNSSFGTRLF